MIMNLQPDLNEALFVRRNDEQKSGSGRRKSCHKKTKAGKLNASSFLLYLFYSFQVRTVFCTDFDFVAWLDE